MEALPYSLAQKTVNRYACSNCWGALEISYNDLVKEGFVFVLCKKCQDETRGYVSQYFVNRRRGESEFEKRDIDRLLRRLNIIPELQHIPAFPGESNQNRWLRELGF